MSMFLKIREKWCDILENILECPVCLKIPDDYIYQCVSGHHICTTCYLWVEVCPTCNKSLTTARNYLAEALSVNFKDIKTSLMYPTHKINKICVYTQTQDIPKESVGVQIENIFLKKNKFTQTKRMSVTKNVKIQTENKVTVARKNKQKLLYPRVGRGIYPCHIGSCVFSLPHGKMIEHLKSCHTDVFYIFQENNGIFKKKCKLQYIVPRYHDLAFFIKYMGLFFVNITILPTGDLAGGVFVVNSAFASKQFIFELTIGIGKTATTYSGMVKSCRVSRVRALKDCLYKTNFEMQKILHKNGMFNCSLNIRRSNLTEINHDFMKHE